MKAMDRRHFMLSTGAGSLAAAFLGLSPAGTHRRLLQEPKEEVGGQSPLSRLHHSPRAKRVIWLHMAGSPSQLDTFQPKPALTEYDGKDCPAEYLEGERFAFIKGIPKLLAPPHGFKQHGESGHWFTELLPHTGAIADKLTFVHSMHTTQFNHAPAQIFLNSGHQVIGRPSMGSWLSWGLGSESQSLPAFVVMTSGQYLPSGGSSCWSPGFLPSEHQGVRLMNNGDPVLFLSNPEGTNRTSRRRELDALRDLNEEQLAKHGDPETKARIQQYELAFRMQAEVPELADLSSESPETLDLYGVEPGKSSFATNCLLARRLSEAGVRFIQLYDWGWDLHGTNASDDLVTQFPRQCKRTDRACAALITDLERRGLLDDTIVIWGGEFGRTPMNEERNGSKLLGRDHHPHAFSIWMCGGGFRPGIAHGATDELGYYITENPVSVHDLHATLLHQLGIDHEQFTYRSQGRDFRLTDVEGSVVRDLLA